MQQTKSANPKADLRKSASDTQPEAWLLEVGAFPLEEPAASWLLGRLEGLISHVRSLGPQNVEIFLESNGALKDDAFPSRLFPNTPKWRPKMGLGIWPAREPPRLASQEDFESIKPGGRPVQHRFPLVRVTTALDARLQALRTMSDLGNVTAVVIQDDSDGYLQRTKDLLTPRITEPAYRGAGFYTPLLDWPSVAEAEPPSLERWLAGAALYVRESLEDSGVIILSPEPLTKVFEDMGFERKPGDKAQWSRPIEE